MCDKEIQTQLKNIMGLCYEISTETEADVLFEYSPICNSISILAYPYGYHKTDKYDFYITNKGDREKLYEPIYLDDFDYEKIIKALKNLLEEYKNDES